MRAVSYVCRGLFLCDWKTTAEQFDDDAYKRHDLDHYLRNETNLAVRERTNTVKIGSLNTVHSFNFQQMELRRKIAEIWVEFDDTLGMYRPLLDYAAIKRLRFLERTGQYIQVECSTPIYTPMRRKFSDTPEIQSKATFGACASQGGSKQSLYKSDHGQKGNSKNDKASTLSDGS